MKVLVMCRYAERGASSRYRTLQYLPALRAAGFELDVHPLLDDGYLGDLYAGRKTRAGRVMAAYADRVRRLLGAGGYDLVWVEKEFLPWVPEAWLHALLRGRAPYVVDYDDALFHRYDEHRNPLVRRLLGRKIDRVMRHAAMVIAGNQYLAARAEAAGARRVEVLPTVIDLERYPLAPRPVNEAFTVGWIGSPSTTKYLELLGPALAPLAAERPLRLVAVGASELTLPGVPVEVRPWSPATEIADLQAFDVGVMPLPDSPWERGKCGFKLIQYMACACPVVGSPVGVNADLIEAGANGFPATTADDWTQALRQLADDPGLRARLGATGRRLVEERYCLQVTAPRLIGLLREAAGRA